MSRQLKGNNAIQIQFSGTPTSSTPVSASLAPKNRAKMRGQKPVIPFLSTTMRKITAHLCAVFRMERKAPSAQVPEWGNYETNPRPLMMSGLG
jgi:hypothetical protein